MSNQTLMKQSRVGYTSRSNRATHQEIQTGCLQRIADATELMCKDREKLERDYQDMRSDRDYYRSEAMRLQRQLSATKGVVTKLKKKLKALLR